MHARVQTHARVWTRARVQTHARVQTYARVQTLLFGQGAVGHLHQLCHVLSCLCMCLLHMFDAFWQGVGVHELKLGFLQQMPLLYVLTASVTQHQQQRTIGVVHGEL